MELFLRCYIVINYRNSTYENESFLVLRIFFLPKNLNFSYSTLTQPVGKLSEVEKKKKDKNRKKRKRICFSYKKIKSIA